MSGPNFVFFEREDIYADRDGLLEDLEDLRTSLSQFEAEKSELNTKITEMEAQIANAQGNDQQTVIELEMQMTMLHDLLAAVEAKISLENDKIREKLEEIDDIENEIAQVEAR